MTNSKLGFPNDKFIDHIEVSQADKKFKTRESIIVYHFIGAFDFTRAMEEALNTTQKQQRRHSRQAKPSFASMFS